MKSSLLSCSLLSLLLFVNSSRTSTTCHSLPPCECRRIHVRMYVICSNVTDVRSLGEAVNGDQHRELPWVRIVNSNLNELGPRAFDNLRAQSLQINSSNLSVIAQDAFVGLENLRFLVLKDNLFENVPSIGLQLLQGLQTLSLAGNNIRTVENGAFDHLRSLHYLSLSENCITNVSENAFPKGVMHLALSANRLTRVGRWLRNLQRLEWLLLSYNEIENLHDDLHNHPSLRTIFLSGNLVNDTRGMFRDLPRLRELTLGRNQLQSLVFDAPLPALHVLDVSDNILERLEPESTVNIPHLSNLNISGNNLQEWPHAAFTPLLHLFSLDISRNNLSNLDDMQPGSLPALKLLWISGNSISSLTSELFFAAPALRKIDLSYNLITTLDPRILPATCRLRLLHTEGNPLVCDTVTKQFLSKFRAEQICPSESHPNAVV